MHGLPHHVDRDLTWEEAFEHLMALSTSESPVTVNIGGLASSGSLRIIKTLDSGPEDPEGSEQPRHVLHLGDHAALMIRPAEFQSAHLWTADGDDYFNLSLLLAVPLTLTHAH